VLDLGGAGLAEPTPSGVGTPGPWGVILLTMPDVAHLFPRVRAALGHICGLLPVEVSVVWLA
jgi:hypothetical protein